jgi:hypothetical protein
MFSKASICPFTTKLRKSMIINHCYRAGRLVRKKRASTGAEARLLITHSDFG